MMGDTKALQAGTSHFLGQNFAKAFDIKFLDENNQLQYCWTTSWGVSTRFIGAIIMTHGDDQGLVLPPNLAPHQVVIVPIYRKDEEKALVMETVDKIVRGLGNLRVFVDRREGVTPGYKFNDWELKGVPLRIEVGPKDVQNGTLALARRDIPGKEGKRFIPMAGFEQAVPAALAEIQTNMLAKATKFRDEHIFEVTDYDEFKDVVENKGWAKVWWYDDAENRPRSKRRPKPLCVIKPNQKVKASASLLARNQQTGLVAGLLRSVFAVIQMQLACFSPTLWWGWRQNPYQP